MEEKILLECKDLVDDVCQRYGYNTEDKEGNDSLRTVLLKAIPAMLKDSKKEDRELFYSMLSHTTIVVTQDLTQERFNELIEQYIRKDTTSHIIEEDELGEYGSSIGAGAYVSEPILDENMNLQGKKSFLYIQRVSDKQKEFYGTDINVSHLIHELGHAWHAEKDEYSMQQDGILKKRVGTAEFIYSLSKTEDNNIKMKCNEVTGLMIEEGMNTISEEAAMANYMNISLEEMQKEYKKTLVPSNYQGYMADFVKYMMEKLGKDDFENYRLYGDIEIRDKINELMSKTEYWKNRNTEILSSSDSPRNYDRKRNLINSINNKSVQEFFKQYESLYFPDISNITPLEKIDNVLEQKFDLNMTRYNMGIEKYAEFLDILGYEGYGLINQAADLLELNKREEQVHINPSQALKNALKETTKSKVKEALILESSEKNMNISMEGKTKDDK